MLFLEAGLLAVGVAGDKLLRRSAFTSQCVQRMVPQLKLKMAQTFLVDQN